MKELVFVAMSGGVDSSTAATLLKKQGYDVAGITMYFGSSDLKGKKVGCYSNQGIEDAQRVARKLNIRHYTLNIQRILEVYVIKDFYQEYIKGRTPNPCVRCNQFIKFDALLKKAFSLGAKFLATGHYARIVKTCNLQLATPKFLLKKAKDKLKDQSYFLYRLSQNQLKHILFPLGDYTKSQVRDLAKKFNLPVADKSASQEICFLPEANYRAFLKHRLHRLSRSRIFYPAGSRRAGKDTDYTDLKPGPIVDIHGKILGQHKGIAFYTIGQRQGLGIAKGYPLYINKIDYKNNRITVGTKKDALKREFIVKKPSFILGPIKKKVVLKVKIRYNHKEALAEVAGARNKMRVKFIKPQFAVTPGQSAVFYDKDIVLGGGIIDKVLN